MAHRNDHQALWRAWRRDEIWPALPLQQPHANVREVQRRFPEEATAKRRRKSSAPFRSRSQGYRSRTRSSRGCLTPGQDPANLLPHGLLRARTRERQGRPVVSGFSAGHAADRRQNQAVPRKFQRVRQQEDQRAAETEELSRSGVCRRSRQRRSQAQSPRENLAATFLSVSSLLGARVPFPPFPLSLKTCHAYTVLLSCRP